MESGQQADCLPAGQREQVLRVFHEPFSSCSRRGRSVEDLNREVRSRSIAACLLGRRAICDGPGCRRPAGVPGEGLSRHGRGGLRHEGESGGYRNLRRQWPYSVLASRDEAPPEIFAFERNRLRKLSGPKYALVTELRWGR